jgi:diaminohydroxyphosphoribosylaminopyrimidine deaminase / 5-amino-6-(5-phosphoribosylamino)uracil reductase
MQRCRQLARHGAGKVAPNPMVGAVLVQNDHILAEGWHRKFGGAHAEVECLKAFGDRPVPDDAILYVDLEPCAHFGKTPPCADLLIERGVKHVVIGQRDPFWEVAGKGIEKLKAAGINVITGIEEEQCRWQQRRFITSIEKNRPYIILKWARSIDGFLDRHPRGERGVQRISNDASNILVHRWRSEEQAIMVGSRTVVNDDPRLSVRLVEGRQPMRIVLDRAGWTPADSHVYDGSSPTLLFCKQKRSEFEKVEQIMIGDDPPLDQVLRELHQRNIRSMMVEGGAVLLNEFLAKGLWDEARVITGNAHFGNGTQAPTGLPEPLRTLDVSGDRLDLHVNEAHQMRPLSSWYW